jgi:hypothetical protein
MGVFLFVPASCPAFILLMEVRQKKTAEKSEQPDDDGIDTWPVDGYG